MAIKKIILDFKNQPEVNDFFKYKIYLNNTILNYGSGLTSINLKYRIAPDSHPYEIGIGTDLDDTINRTLAFLNSAYTFSGSIGGYTLVLTYARIGNKIEVSLNTNANIDLIGVWQAESTTNVVTIGTDTPCLNSYISNNSLPNKYNTIFLLPNGNYNLVNIDLGISIPISIPYFNTIIERGYSYKITDLSGGYLTPPFYIYKSVEQSNINAYFANNTLTINIFGIQGFDINNYQFSIDGTSYQDLNQFPGLAEGDYTYYIKDSIGCIKSFSISNNGLSNLNNVNPYIFISESNSLRIVESVTHGNCGNYKNVFNTLSCQEETQITNSFIQLFQSCDTNIVTQIKTSYDNIEIVSRDQYNNLVEIEVNKIVNNIGISDKRDCIYYALNGLLAIKFISGNIYNYGTTDIIDTYTLNGDLPEFATIGTFVETDYGTLPIANIFLSDSGERSIVFNVMSSIVDIINSTIQTIYNRDTFNIWEFTINMNDYLDKIFNIGLRFYQNIPSDLFQERYFISEKINVKERHSRSKELKWYNSKNTDIYFYSGIQMKNRLNFVDVNTQISDGNVENQRTDSQVIPIDATNYNSVEFEVNFLSTGMLRKILLALKHDNLIIENIPYVLTDNPEVNRIGKSNFYTLRAKLVEAGDVWNQGTANTQTIYSNVELIGFIQGDSDAEYLRIK